MEIRRLTADDWLAHKHIKAEAFAQGARPAPDELPPLQQSPSLGVFDGTRLVAASTVHPLHVTWGDHDAPLGGVAGVACTVGERVRGHVGRLLAQSLREMREDGQYLSGLYPFSYAFYRRHGWEWVGEKRRFSVPTAVVVADPEGRNVQTYDGPAAREAVSPVYDAFARRYPGMTTRTDPVPDWWASSLAHDDNRTTYVHVHYNPETGQADGYFSFRYPQGDPTAHLREFFALTPAALRGLLSVIHYYGTQIKTVELTGPADHPLPLHVMHHDLSITASPLFMGRIVDVAAALAALHPATVRGQAIVQVLDAICDWNCGTFAVEVEEGQISVAPTSQTPGITLDIQALTQAYWGQPSLMLLRQGGRIHVTDEVQFHLLLGLLPPTISYLQDFF